MKVSKILIGLLLVTTSLTSCGVANTGSNYSSQGSDSNFSTHEHSFSSSYEYDETYHWHPSTCGHDVQGDKEEHTFIEEITNPTYESGGYTTYTCSVCGYSYTDDEVDKLEHNYSSTWSYNSSSHWHACTDEGYEHFKKDEGSHTFTTSVTDPTYESGGYTTYTCSVCGYSYTDDEVDALPITITWKNYDGTVLEVDNNVPYGTMPSYDGETPTKESDSNYDYIFAGWTPSVVIATQPTTYVATFSNQEITYTIDFDLNGGKSNSYDGPIEVKTFGKDVFFFDCVKEGWSFRGWEYQNEKIFDEKGNQLKNVVLVDNMIFKAIYTQTVKLTIVSNVSEAGIVTGEGEYPYNTYVDVSATPNQGYKFIGWYYQGTLLSNTEDYKYMMWDQDITLEARFELDYFTMHVYSNSEEHGLVLLRSNSNFDYLPEYQEQRKYTSDVTIAAYSKTDVRFLGWYDENNQLVTTNAVYSFVMPNHDYTLEAKWNHFEITYNLNGGVNNENNPTSYSIDDGNITLNAPTKEGYEFVGWKYNDEFVDEINTNTIDDITLEAVWSSYKYTIKEDSNGNKYASIIDFDNSIAEVNIPSEVVVDSESIPVKEIGSRVFEDSTTIISITIPDSVTTIGNSAFSGCDSLTSIIIPDSVTTIGYYAFENCSNLTIYCEAASEPDGWSSSWNISACPVVWGYTGIGAEYNGFEYAVCIDSEGNKYITITGYDGIDTDVIVPDTISVDGEDIHVTTIGDSAFYDNDTITSVTIGNNVTTIGERAFYNCDNLTTVTIGENSQLTTIGSYAFYGCSSLTSITVPNNVTTIGTSAFYGCDNLTIYCEATSKPSGWSSSWNYSNRPVVWDSIGGGVYDGLEYVIRVDENNKPYIEITGYLESDTNLTIPNTINVNDEEIKVTAIGDNAFYSCDSLTSITVPNNVTTIGEWAFYGCSSLTSITVPNNVTTIGEWAFYGCDNLTIYCEATSNPSGWSSSWNISAYPVVWVGGDIIVDGDYAYVVRTNGEERYVEIVRYLGSEEEVVIPDTINVDGEVIKVTTIGERAFYNCDNLTTVTIGENSQLTTIGDYAFSWCSNLTSITIPDSVTTIGNSAFSGCDSLTSIIIPDSVTTIGYSAFYNCSNLTIYCEAASEPDGWSSSWNYSNRPVVWGYEE